MRLCADFIGIIVVTTIGYFYFETMSSFQNAMGPNREKLRADVPNYTNIQPVIQISEVQTAE